MSQSSSRDVYFTKHALRTGLKCPTRLFYKAGRYPENREAQPFIAHYRYNKQQLKRLAKYSLPPGMQVYTSSIEQAAEETSRYLQEEEIVLYDPVFIHGHYMAKVPILQKWGRSLNVYHVQTKAFQPGKHSVSNREGRIYSKWRDYITDFAFQVHIIAKCYPDWQITPFLILPAKYGRAQTDKLHRRMREIYSEGTRSAEAPLNEEELVLHIDVSDEVERVRSGRSLEEEPYKDMSFESILKKLSERFYSNEKHPVSIGNKCKDCEFRIERERLQNGERSGFTECWDSALDTDLIDNYKHTVFELIGPGTNHWIERGIYFQEDVPAGEYYEVETIQRAKGRMNEKQRQSLQILQAKGQDVPREIIKPNLFKELQRWEYPIHFLDFEAGNYTIPIREGRKPYHLLVFQYSCHTLFEDGSWTHHEWIDKRSEEYPNYEMVRQLKGVPNITEGTIVQYSNFERNALKTIQKELMQEDEVPDAEELKQWLSDIIRRRDSSHKSGPYLADLSRMVKHFYYNHKMEDSLSIKDVLQSVLTISPRLKELYTLPYSSANFDAFIWWQSDSVGDAQSPYRLMLNNQEQGVRRGTEAMVVYARLLSEDLDDQQQEHLQEALLRYCEVDTLAMVMIFQHWKFLMEQKWN